jgi:hypothetical protein
MGTFWKASVEEKDLVVDDSSYNGGSSYINKSGIYYVTIKKAWVDKSKGGSESISMLVDYKGVEQPIFGAIRLTNNNGKPNFQAKLFNQLMIVCGIEEIDEPSEETITFGKNKTKKTIAALPEFEDEEVQLRIAMEYSVWNGEIQERKVLKNVYSSTGHTAAELVNGLEATQLNKDLEKYANQVIYKDGLTEDDVAKWKEQFVKKDDTKAEAPKAAKKNPFKK